VGQPFRGRKGTKKRRLLIGKSLGSHNDEHRNMKMGVQFKTLFRYLSLMSQLHARRLPVF